jgi:hypothetical protein
VQCPPRGASVLTEPCASVVAEGVDEMKRVVVTVEFMLRAENDLHEMTEEELATEIRDLFEDEHRGLAEYGSAGVMALMAREE